MTKNVSSLEGMVIFEVHLYGNKEGNKDNSYVSYHIRDQTPGRAVDLAKELARRDGYTNIGLVINPSVAFSGMVHTKSKYFKG